MEQPDHRLFESDLHSAEFRIGWANGSWGLPDSETLPAGLAWPQVILWVAAAARPNAPDRFYFALDAAGYRSVPPTGTLWDSATRLALDVAKRPKGRTESRFAKVFRTDWNNAALYHPYDRVAAVSHPQWATEQPSLAWTADHTIADYLTELHTLLDCGDYLGV